MTRVENRPELSLGQPRLRFFFWASPLNSGQTKLRNFDIIDPGRGTFSTWVVPKKNVFFL